MLKKQKIQGKLHCISWYIINHFLLNTRTNCKTEIKGIVECIIKSYGLHPIGYQGNVFSGPYYPVCHPNPTYNTYSLIRFGNLFWFWCFIENEIRALTFVNISTEKNWNKYSSKEIKRCHFYHVQKLCLIQPHMIYDIIHPRWCIRASY